MRKNYLLQIFVDDIRFSDDKAPVDRHQKDIFLDNEYVPLSELKPGLTMKLWKILWPANSNTSDIREIEDYLEYKGEIKFK